MVGNAAWIRDLEEQRGRLSDDLAILEAGKVLHGTPQSNRTPARIVWLKHQIAEVEIALQRECTV
jgi:hypothetical protein